MRIKRLRRHVSAANGQGPLQPGRANDSWSMGFVSDSLLDGQRLRALTIVDNLTRESFAIAVEQGIIGEQVAAVLERIVAERRVPKSIGVDNGPNSFRKFWTDGLTNTA